MSTRQASERDDPIIERREQLAAPMAAGEKPREAWRIGTEHEKLVYRTADHRAPSFLTNAILHFGQRPGSFETTSGCIGQV